MEKTKSLAAQTTEALTFSICIPSKNRFKDLERCLQSIYTQEVLPDEILIIDQSDQKYDLPIRAGLTHIYDPGISGAAAARNRASMKSSGDIILFLDDDVELLPHCLSNLKSDFGKHPEAVAIQCTIIQPNIQSSLTEVRTWLFQRGFFNSARRNRKGVIELRRLAGGATAFRRKLFMHEHFDENLVSYSYGEDWEFSYRAGRYGKMLLAPSARLIHYSSPVNRYKFEQLLRDRWDNFLYFYDKLEASRFYLNRFWRIWWMFGESLQWARFGLGFPILGWRTRRVPQRSQSRSNKS